MSNENTVYLKDYQKPDYMIPHIDLEFNIIKPKKFKFMSREYK